MKKPVYLVEDLWTADPEVQVFNATKSIISQIIIK